MFHRVAALLLLALPALAACSAPYTPSTDRPFEPIPEFTSSANVTLVNAQPDTESHKIGHRLRANYNEWTDVAIQIAQRELSKRGVRVEEGAPRTLRMAITNVHAWTGWVKLGTDIDMEVETGDGYKVTLKGLNNSVMGGNPRRQVDGAVMRVVVEMLKDPGIVAYLEDTSAATAAP